MQDILDIEDIVTSPWPHRLTIVFWILVSILGLVLLWKLWRWIQKKIKLKREKKLLPHELAFARLADLQKKKFLEKKQFYFFYDILSQIFRGYLENQFRFLAIESTSQEIFFHLQKQPLFDFPQKNFIEDFLKRADSVKFAKDIPSIEKAEDDLKKVSEFIQNFLPFP